MENMDWVRYFWIALSWSFWGWFMLLVVFLVGLVLRFFWKIVFPPYSSPLSESTRDYNGPSRYDGDGHYVSDFEKMEEMRGEELDSQRTSLVVEILSTPFKAFIAGFGSDDDDDDEDEDKKSQSYSAWDIFR